MRPSSDYIYVAIETAFNTLSLIIMIPCIATLIRTTGIHENCKFLLVTSASVQLLLLIVQAMLFNYNIVIDNLAPLSNGDHSIFSLLQRFMILEKELPFLMVQNGLFEKLFADSDQPFIWIQNGLFTMASYLNLVLVLERCFAVWDPAKQEGERRHLSLLSIFIGTSAVMAALHVYAIFWHNWNMKIIYVVYAVEGCTIIISIVIIFFCRWKLVNIPYDTDRLSAKYQIREVLRFSVAILPSIVLSSIMHTISLIPSILFQYGVIDWALSCLFYFSVHSLNCVVTKITLILFHPAMRIKLRSMLFTRLQLVYSF
ncbi:hypothetical protein PFISCL1PPCAC_716, partial [Pristionchus fissidentatus]